MPSQDTGGRTAAITIVCIAVAVLSVFGAMNSYQVSARYAEQYPDTYGVNQAKARFAPVIAQIPAGAQLGYISDLKPNDAQYSAIFLAAQYALAPRQLVTGEKNRPEWAVGNFTKPQDFAAAGAGKGYEMVSDFGGGVVLYKRK